MRKKYHCYIFEDICLKLALAWNSSLKYIILVSNLIFILFTVGHQITSRWRRPRCLSSLRRYFTELKSYIPNVLHYNNNYWKNKINHAIAHCNARCAKSDHRPFRSSNMHGYYCRIHGRKSDQNFTCYKFSIPKLAHINSSEHVVQGFF